MTIEHRVEHRVECHDLNAHYFRVTLTIPQPAAQQIIALSVWIPGSYLVREFAKQLQGVTARQGGKKVALHQMDNCTWMIDCKAGSSAPSSSVQVSYLVYAFDASVRTAYLDTSRGFFNGTSLFMRVLGQESSVQQVVIEPPKQNDGWRVATALSPVKTNKTGWGTYQADNYDELADSPFELGDFWQGQFTVRGILHRFVVSGAAPTFDSKRLLADAQKIVATALSFWHGANGKPPQDLLDKGYVFMLYATQDGYGGLEHKHSTALIAKRSDLPREASLPSEGYIALLGLISHEYFHTWNVKRLRPAEFACIDYTRENHTQMLWFFEGFTSYYDDLLLRRAGLISDQQYLGLLAKTINQVLQTPGRLVHSLSSSSFEAWTKYYRPDENSVNSTVSYYTKGALVALCLDLSLIAAGSSLDHVMLSLWERCHQNGNDGVMTETDLLDVLQLLGGRSFAPEIKAWVHGTKDLPLTDLMATVGVETTLEKAPLAQQLGLKLGATASSITVKTVLHGSIAAKAGFSPGDEWLAIEVGQQTWRITAMDDLLLYAQAGKGLIAWVARDKAIIKLELMMPKTSSGIEAIGSDALCKEVPHNGQVALHAADLPRIKPWLNAHQTLQRLTTS